MHVDCAIYVTVISVSLKHDFTAHFLKMNKEFWFYLPMG